MFKRFTEAELLAYVEGELDPKQARGLDARLDATPAVRVVLDRLRADRAVMRAIEDPKLPTDFLAELESRLARPMLIEDDPGSYRRRHRRGGRIVRRVGWAVAAMLLLGSSVTVWIAARNFLLPALDETELVRNETLTVPMEHNEDTIQRPVDEMWPPADAVVHHQRPLPPGSAALARRASEGTTAELRRAGGVEATAGPYATTSFALVLHAEDATAGEAVIVRIVNAMREEQGGAPSSTTLVRNFDKEEAKALIARYGTDVFPATEPVISGANGRTTVRAPQGIDPKRVVTVLDRQTRDIETSKSLIGPRDLAPSYEVQLALSERGATHTLTLSARDLARLVRRFYDDSGLPTSLALLAEDQASSADGGPELTALQRWVVDYPKVRAFLRHLREDGEAHALVHLPIIVAP